MDGRRESSEQIYSKYSTFVIVYFDTSLKSLSFLYESTIRTSGNIRKCFECSFFNIFVKNTKQRKELAEVY